VTAVQAQALVLVLAALAPAAGTAAAGAAWLARLRFRHQAEVIRHDGVLAVLDGTLPHMPAVSGYLAWLGALASRPRRPAIIRAAARPDPVLPGLSPGEQEVMNELAGRVRAAARSCLAWNRPARLLRHPAAVSCPAGPQAEDRRPLSLTASPEPGAAGQATADAAAGPARPPLRPRRALVRVMARLTGAGTRSTR
jgi:hypothetical protein